MPNFMQVIAAPAAYATAPSVEIPFVPNAMQLTVEGAANALVSFDGVNDHEALKTTGPLTSVQLRTANKKVWVKQDGGATNVRITARTDT